MLNCNFTITNNPPTLYHYFVVDSHTNQKVAGPFTKRTTATRSADRRDLQYGAIRYRVISEEVK